MNLWKIRTIFYVLGIFFLSRKIDVNSPTKSSRSTSLRSIHFPGYSGFPSFASLVLSSNRPSLALPKFAPPFSIIAITPYPYEQEKKKTCLNVRTENRGDGEGCVRYPHIVFIQQPIAAMYGRKKRFSSDRVHYWSSTVREVQ